MLRAWAGDHTDRRYRADFARRAAGRAPCPAMCETYPPELRTTGVPVIASPMASQDGAGPDPFDVSAWTGALAATLSMPSLR